MEEMHKMKKLKLLLISLAIMAGSAANAATSATKVDTSKIVTNLTNVQTDMATVFGTIIAVVVIVFGFKKIYSLISKS
jgi:divalent metal cation (Fe/Co/Zn/Cd) transporter